jgi:Flp pilus assembly secretin CpaC
MKHPSRFRRTLVPFIALFLFISVSSIWAAQTVQLEWRIITASHKKGSVDPRLKDIYRDLGTIFNYNSYRLINMNQIKLSQNQSTSIPLSKNKICTIKLTNVSPKWVNVRIDITKGNQSIFGTTARLMNGRMLLIGGPSNRGEALIFSLRSFW